MTIPRMMRAMVLEEARRPLSAREWPVPSPTDNQVLIAVHACAVCRTDLHIVDGELPLPKLPLVPGHEIVGEIVALGPMVRSLRVGERIGVPWLARTCGQCSYCNRGRENLCRSAAFMGYTLDGGYAEYAVVYEPYCFRPPPMLSSEHAAPLLCAGLIGYRAYCMAGAEARSLGLYGFGSAAQIVTQIAVHQGKRVYAFTRPGDEEGQSAARRLGAVWSGDSTQLPPEPLDAAIIFAPVGDLVPLALRATAPGGTVVCGGIHMSDIPSFAYALMWEERVLRSVANLTRRDGEELFALVAQIPIRTDVQVYALEQANDALRDLRAGRTRGTAVLVLRS